MELGTKIKNLRFKAGLTQDALARELGVTAQSVSKWENSVAMPDITLLPAIATEFGVSIDELFDLGDDEKLQRIERRMETEEELPGELFWEYEEYLKERLDAGENRRRILSLLGHLHQHRMESDAVKVSKYAREAIKLAPDVKECQWLLNMSEHAVIWDWNASNHARIIDFYKEIVEDGSYDPQPVSPYYYLIDNLLADHRIEEAKRYIEECRKHPSHKAFLMTVYDAYVALGEYDEHRADGIIEDGLKDFGNEPGFLFETAQYFARKCDYDKAIEFYEASFGHVENRRPRFTDDLEAIAMLYEIKGEYENAAVTYGRMTDCLKNEWGFTDEPELQRVERERRRLLDKCNK